MDEFDRKRLEDDETDPASRTEVTERTLVSIVQFVMETVNFL